MPQIPTPPPPQQGKTPEQQIREAVNAAAVDLVGAGFDAIDRIAEIGKRRLKKAIIAGVSGPRRNRK